MLATKFKIILLSSAMALAVLGLQSCGKEQVEQKSAEEIHKEDGIPVKVTEVTETTFSRDLTFFSRLRGYEESTKGSMVGDQILKINAKVGQSVSAGKVLVEFPANNPQLQLTQSKASLDNAKLTLNRLQNLLKSGETSQQNVDNAQTQYDVARRNYESIKQYIYIQAPISGVITEMKYKQGDFVKAGDPLFTVAKLNKMIAQIWASEKEVLDIHVGMKAEVKVGSKIFTGRVSLVPLAMDDSKRAFGVEVMLDNPRRELKSGVTVETKINIYNKPNTIAILKNLVQWDGKDRYVYLDDGGVAKKCVVTVGETSGLNIEVLSGLKTGDRLITEGQAQVTDGGKIKIVK